MTRVKPPCVFFPCYSIVFVKTIGNVVKPILLLHKVAKNLLHCECLFLHRQLIKCKRFIGGKYGPEFVSFLTIHQTGSNFVAEHVK